jgi:hypothetical protein
MFGASNELTRVADVKVDRVKGNSRWYPQLRLPSRYGDIVGQKASICAASDGNDDIAFVIRVAVSKNQAAYRGISKLEEAHETGEPAMPSKPHGGHGTMYDFAE